MSKNMPPYWTEYRIFHSGDDYFDHMLSSIRSAQQSVQIEVYIFEYDSLTLLILDELKKARIRGCQIQILVDGFGSMSSINVLETFCLRADLQFRVFRPLPARFSWFTKFGLFSLFRVQQLFRRLNRRDHRKLVLVDGNMAYLGSLNLTKVHSKKHFGAKAWRDVGVYLKGDSIKDLDRAFRVIWQRAGRGVFKRFFRRGLRDRFYHPNKSLIRLNTSLRDRFFLYRETLRKIKTAKKYVYIETAYFLPRRGLLKALKKAAENGVQVEVIIPGISDVPLVKWAGLEVAYNLLKSGVKIYEYQDRVLHAKFMLVDDWGSVGSTNMNHRSLLHDLEVEAVFTDPLSLENLKDSWIQDRLRSKALSIDKYVKIPWFKRFLSRLAFTLRYWL